MYLQRRKKPKNSVEYPYQQQDKTYNHHRSHPRYMIQWSNRRTYWIILILWWAKKPLIKN